MDIRKSQKVVYTYIFFVIIIGLFAFFIAPRPNIALSGLGLGGIASLANFFLLSLMIKTLVNENYFLTVQVYVLRALIYLVSAFFSVKIGYAGAITFGISIVGISFAIALVYGFGGRKNNG